jgi:hypothetical protein
MAMISVGTVDRSKEKLNPSFPTTIQAKSVVTCARIAFWIQIKEFKECFWQP